FFITIGMLLNPALVARHWWVVLLLLSGPVLLKFGVIAGLARLFGANTGVALRTGLALAQAGEFGFVLINQMGDLRMADPLMIQLVLASMVISMLIAPFVIAKSDAIVMKFSANEWMLQSLALTQIATRTMTTQKHVIIAGFGRSGQHLAKLLEEEGIAYHALDLDPDRVREAQAAGANVSYGDAARRESLKAAGIARAAAMVITYADTAAAIKTLHFAHEVAPKLPVIVRSYDDMDLDKLREAGASEVVPEALEGSLMLASHALVRLGVPLRRVVHRVQEARDERYASLRGYFHGLDDMHDDAENIQTRLHSVPLDEGARAVGRPLSALKLDEVGADVMSIRRGKRNLEVGADTVLQANDIVVLRGPTEAVARAEARLL
ncbi:MAG TPA: NAD-binding protein, partial [Burkholderiaceae bacterium]